MAIGNSFFYRFVVALVCVLSTDAATLGQFCNATITCTGDPVVCSDTNTCVCGTNYQQNSAENTCVVGLSSQCPNPGSDKCLDPNAVCTNESTVFTCLCNSLYYNNEGTCVLKVALGGACPNGTTDACLDTNATCTGTCTCKSTHYNNNGKCEPKVALGGACPTGTTEACLDTNANCTGTCTCKSTHYNNNSKCNPKVALGGACPNGTTGACLDTNATCTGTCTCKSTHYSNNGKCEPKKSLGYTCSQQVIQCADTNAECVGSSGTGTCQCKTGFYDSNGESLDGMCVAKVELNSGCSHPSACVTNNAACINNTCSCQSGFYDSNGVKQGGLCNIKVGLGSACPQPDACGTTDAVCSNPSGGGTCVCGNGYYDSNGNTALNGSCLLKVGLGLACPQPDACSTPDAVCSHPNGGGACVCYNGYYDSNGITTSGGNCITKTALGEHCPQPDACQPQYSECGSRTVCVCSASYFDSNGVSNIGGSCSAKLGLGFSCTQIDACSDINANCNQSTCVCNTGYYDSNGPGTNGGICLFKVGLGERCPRPDACNTPNSMCSNINGGGTCICSSVYYDDNGNILGGNCLQKVQLGSPCNMSTACAEAKSSCVGAKCQCSSDYYDDTGVNLGGNCQHRLFLNNRCESSAIHNYNQTDQCQDGNAACHLNSSYNVHMCTCNLGYHSEEFTCVAEKPLGGSCTHKTDCSDPNADCIGSKCTCGSRHYDSNGRVDGGNCMPRSGEPTNLTVTGVTSRSMNVAWSYPERTNSEEILGYILQIKDTSSSCVHEQLFKCQDCTGSFQDPVGVLCPVDVRQADIFVSKQQLKERRVYNVTGLLPDTEYTISVSAVNLDGQGNISFLVHRTDEEGKRPTLGEVIGVIGGGIVVLSTVGFIIYRYKHWENKSLKNGYNEDRLATPRNRPVKLFEFPTYVADMHEEQNLKFSRSFEDLKALGLNHKQSVATETKNQMKNRDMHVLPYDHSRVVLRSEHGMDDYINASFLPGYRSVREYIGCQGPLPGTVKDFWRMVWEQNVSVVVMLTLCREHNEEFRIIYVKCEQYWPSVINEPKQFGDVEVQLISSSSFPSYNYNVMKVVCNGRPRIIEHFQFLSWRNMTTNDAFIDFITQVRKHVQPPESAGPLLVHCSNGAGRTGIYIILDHLIQFIDDHDFESSIDIFGMVLKLRENRPNIVETMHQYEFIHDCVNTILARKYSASSQGNTFETIKSSERNVYQNLQKHAYEMLNLN